MTVMGRFFLGIVLLVGTLVFEVVLAMILFTWIAYTNPSLFGALTNIAGQMLDSVTALIRGLAPEVQNAAYSGAAGDLSPRAFLLLILGLLASGVIRMVIWIFRAMLRRDA